jgi:hypothetical protein
MIKNTPREIGLIDVDYSNFPNIALMKISAYYKSLGYSVNWANYFLTYEKVFFSKIFTFSSDIAYPVKANEIIKGGTGYNLLVNLPGIIDDSVLDYSLYPKFPHAYGFLSRGCINNCKWCLVPIKEGTIKPYRDISDILQGRQSAILMDNNILASDYGLRQIEKIVKLKIKVDFNQGLDARLITPEIANLLSKVKWLKYIRFACDSKDMIEPVLKSIELLQKNGVGKWRFSIYMLLSDSLESAYLRALTFKKHGLSINPQPYRNFTNSRSIPQWQKDFARWGYKKELFTTIDFKDYEPRKSFFCRQYFI